MFCAVIVAAGSSRRAGFDKLAAHLDGSPVLRRSVDAFVSAGCSAVVVVCPEPRWREVGLADAAFPIPVLRADGGAGRGRIGSSAVRLSRAASTTGRTSAL